MAGSKGVLLEAFGKYQLIEKLAEGGMARVYLAQETGPNGRRVALKQILPHLVEDPAFLTMFLDEARIAALLHHPNVVEIYDLGKEGDALFIAMEFIHGEDLRRIEKRTQELGRTFPFALACRVIREAARGLDYAHRRADAQGKNLDIVHRDVSPQNILVAFDGSVKVVDFGVAKAADKATVTASGVIKGKHPYMSPEQALGKENLDRRTDVFALGVVLYEAVTGIRLFRRATDMQTLQAVAECEVVPPTKVVSSLPRDLDEVLMMALARDRAHRFDSCDAFGTALDVVLARYPDATPLSVGRLLSELFADRLQREARAGRFVPTFGTPAADSLPDTPSPAFGFDKAKTIELGVKDEGQQGPVPESFAPALRKTQPGSVDSDRELAKRRDLETKEARRAPAPQPPSSETQRPTPQQVARAPLQTITALHTGDFAPVSPNLPPPTSVPPAELPAISPDVLARPALPAIPPASLRDSETRVRRAGAPRWLFGLLALAPLVGFGSWYAVNLQLSERAPAAPPQPVATPVRAVEAERAAPPPAAAPEPAVAAETTRPPQGFIDDCPVVFPVVAEGKHLFVRTGDLTSGAALRLVSDVVPDAGTTRGYFGMAMVVETSGSQARVITDDPTQLPKTLFACAPSDEGALKGNVFAKTGSSAVGILNNSDLEWTGCELTLPNNTFARLPPHLVLRPGKLQWLNGLKPTARKAGAEPKLKANQAHLHCVQGDGDLPVSVEGGGE